MGKGLIAIISLVVGVVLGGILTFYFLVGAPSASQIPGEPIKAPDPNGPPPGTATVVLNQQFFNTVLQTIFKDMNSPSFPLQVSKKVADEDFRPIKTAFLQDQNQCTGQITLLPEGSGVKTSVKLENGQIIAPLAFKGDANVFGNCIQFSGWAQGGFTLNYDAEQQMVFGKINVETVNLDGVTPMASGLIAQFVQNALNQKVNPITILNGKQIALSLPINAAEGTLNAQIKDVRAEVKENDLSLFVTYDFSGTKGLQ